jgi:hypothetical protein
MHAEKQTKSDSKAILTTNSTNNEAVNSDPLEFSASPTGKVQRAKPSLTLKNVLQLQRAIGNRAVSRLIAEQKQRQNSTTPNSESKPVQRRIGFEVETGIPLTKKVTTSGGTKYHGLFVSDVGDDLKVAHGKLSPDHIPGTPAHKATPTERFDDWPIVELVTDPIDDMMKPTEFEPIARGWIDQLKEIKTEAQKSPPAQQLLNEYYVGLPSAQAYSSWDRIAPQVTVGVPLDQAGKLLSSFSISGTKSQGRASELAKLAPSKAATVMQGLLDKYPSSDGAGVQALKGLLVMMCTYMMVGGDPDIANVFYMKNRPSNVFIKSKLSVVRNNIVSSSKYLKDILKTNDGRKFIREQLLAVTGRGSGDKLFIAGTKADKEGNLPSASDVTVDTWVREVLRGIDDKVFDEMKNEWSTDIKPDDKNEVVIELRKLGNFLTHSNFALEDDAGLLEFMKKVYLINKAYKQRMM